MTARLYQSAIHYLFATACFTFLHASATYAKDTEASLHFSPCVISGASTVGNLHAQCATWHRPLNPSHEEGPTIELFVAKLASSSNTPAADALTLINGGPGGSSVDLLIQIAPLMKAFTRHRDVIVIDQRGTGRSSPMSCEGIADNPDSYDESKIPELTIDCLNQLPHDPRYFTTSVAVDDLEALRELLGYDQLSLYGVSYGTRVALQYMRLYPQTARAVIIDGVVPPTKILGPGVALYSQQALEAALDRCAEDSACQKTFASTRDALEQVGSRLQDKPINLTLPHPVTGATTDLALDYAHLVAWIRFSLYAPETTALIPIVLNEAAGKNNYIPIASNALRMLHNIQSSMAYGMHNAVVCTEDAAYFAETEVDYGALDNTYLGRTLYDTLKSMCTVWPAGIRHPDLKQPIHSDVPTLLLSGEFDPITPPAWGEVVMSGLSNARHIVAPGQGHGTITRGCMPQIVEHFVQTPDPAKVDAACIEHLRPFPFFLDAMGPSP